MKEIFCTLDFEEYGLDKRHLGFFKMYMLVLMARKYKLKIIVKNN